MRLKALSFLWLLVASGLASAGSLSDAWQAARQHDPDMAVAQAARQTGDARRQQARALWNPTVGASASAGLMGADNRMGGASFSAPGFGGGPSLEVGSKDTKAMSPRTRTNSGFLPIWYISLLAIARLSDSTSVLGRSYWRVNWARSMVTSVTVR